MTDKKLYEDIRGKRSRRDQTMLEVMALFDEQKDETNDWQRRAEWLAEQLAEHEEDLEDERGMGERGYDETCTSAHWLKRAGEEA